MDLSKRDKKIAHVVMEKGLQIEFANGLNKADAVIQTWKKHGQENREAYHLLFKTIRDFDKHIVGRYNYLTGSRYFFVIAEQFADGVITEDDIKDFSPELIQNIRETKRRREEYENE